MHVGKRSIQDKCHSYRSNEYKYTEFLIRLQGAYSKILKIFFKIAVSMLVSPKIPSGIHLSTYGKPSKWHYGEKWAQ
jgi:hypothetical protein